MHRKTMLSAAIISCLAFSAHAQEAAKTATDLDTAWGLCEDLATVEQARQALQAEPLFALDEKGRLILPAKFREQLADGLVITRAQDRCLAIWPTEAFMAVLKLDSD